MTYFIVADVHGFFDEMKCALDAAGFDRNDPEHVFVSLGDLLDRGLQPEKCLEFVNGLERKILIRGNHEDLMEELLEAGHPERRDYHNGTFATARQLGGNAEPVDYEGLKSHKALQTYLHSTVPFYETKSAIFVHGWIPCGEYLRYDDGEAVMCFEALRSWRTLPLESPLWRKARWINGMAAWDAGIREDGKVIFCGHRHCSWGHFTYGTARDEIGAHADYSPFIRDGIVALDACTAESHQVNCVVLKQSDEGEAE